MTHSAAATRHSRRSGFLTVPHRLRGACWVLYPEYLNPEALQSPHWPVFACRLAARLRSVQLDSEVRPGAISVEKGTFQARPQTPGNLKSGRWDPSLMPGLQF